MEKNSEDFTEIVRRHAGLVHSVAWRQLGDDSADDVTQMVFAILARKAPGLTDLRSLSAWLHQVTVLQCRNAVRQRIRERRSHEAAMESARLTDARDPLAEALPYLDEAIAALPDSDRELILLRYSEGLTFSETAHRTGRNEAALRQQAGRALGKLTTLLRRRGVPVPAAVLAAGLGGLLSGPGPAAAAASFATAALAQSAGLSTPALLSVFFISMSATKAILSGVLLAVLISAGPILRKAYQINEARRVHHPATTSPAFPRETVAAPAESDASPSPAAISGTATASPPAGSVLDELGAMIENEMNTTMAEWARRQAWIEARRTGRTLNLPPEMEEQFRAYLDTSLTQRWSDDMIKNPKGGKRGQGRRDYTEKVNEWLATHLTPEQFAANLRQEEAGRIALLEKLAEESLHGIQSSIPLSEDQKAKLYQAAAAKATEALEKNEYGGSLMFSATIEPQKAPPIEEACAPAIAAVLNPEQQELWAQTLEQDRVFSETMPRRLSDRALGFIKERGAGPIIGALLQQAMTEARAESAPGAK